jgi:hypothetical protein
MVLGRIDEGPVERVLLGIFTTLGVLASME